jgi:hypothetical protein
MAHNFAIGYSALRACSQEAAGSSSSTVVRWRGDRLSFTVTVYRPHVEMPSVSIRSFVARVKHGHTTAFLASGLTILRRRRDLTALDLIEVGDQLSDEDFNVIVGLLRSATLSELFQTPKFLILYPWEASSEEYAIEAIKAIRTHFRASVVALDADPVDWEGTPRPDEPIEVLEMYRTEFEAHQQTVHHVIAEVGQALKFSIGAARTPDEVLYAMGAIGAYTKRSGGIQILR